MNTISSTIIWADQRMDYIPFVSLLNNSMDIIAKIALRILGYLSPSTYTSLKDHSIVVHLNNKDFLTCIKMGIPFLNLLFIARMQNQRNVNHNPPQDTSSTQEQLSSHTSDESHQEQLAQVDEIKRKYNEEKMQRRQKMIDGNNELIQRFKKNIEDLQYENAMLEQKIKRSRVESLERQGYESLIDLNNKHIESYETNIRSQKEQLQGMLDMFDKI